MDDRSPDGRAPSVVRIRAAADWCRRKPWGAAGVAVALFALLSLSSGIYAVGNGETAALQRWGQVLDAAVEPGLRLSIPWGVDRVTRVRTGQVQREQIVGDWTKELQLITGDENFIETTVVVQYTITDLGDYLFRVENPPALIGQVLRAALVETVGTMPVDDVLTTGKAAIQQAARRAAQDALDRYRLGVTLLGVNLESAVPPIEAANAFRDVNDAKADAATARNGAQSARERTLSLARGEAVQITLDARARAAARVSQAQGETARFITLLAAQRQAPAQTATDLYLATAQKVLPRAKLVLLAPHQSPHIDLSLVDRPRDMTRPPQDGLGSGARGPMGTH